jgi:hypothetical protein
MGTRHRGCHLVFVRLRGVPLGHERRVVQGMDLFTRPLLPTLVGLLVRVTSRRRWRRFCSPNEVSGPFVSGDVEVRFSKQLLGGSRRLLQYGSDQGRVIKSPVEVFDHYRLSDFRDTVSHGLESFEVLSKCFITPAPDGFEVPWLRQFVREGLKVGDEAPTEVVPIVDAVSW